MILRVWVKESEETLKKQIKSESNAVSRDKLRALLLIKTDQVFEIKDLAKLLNRHRNSISIWLEKYRKGGMSLLFQEKKRVNKKKL